jgi:V8-like Glu-specific endopeptidase
MKQSFRQVIIIIAMLTSFSLVAKPIYAEINIPDVLKRCVLAIGIKDYNYNESTGEESVNIIFRGTGFLIWDDRYILVTARHVVFDNDGKVFPNLCFWGNEMNGEQFLRSVSEIQRKYEKIEWIAASYPASDVDIAASVVELNISEENLGFLTRDGFAKMKDIDIGNDIYYLGYPDDIGTKHDSNPVIKSNPVLRGGMVAYKEKDYFYIDAVVAPGNSGGPVFKFDKKTDSVNLIGIVSAFKPFVKEGMSFHSGLGIVFSADSIRELLDSIPFKKTM